MKIQYVKTVEIFVITLNVLEKENKIVLVYYNLHTNLKVKFYYLF